MSSLVKLSLIGAIGGGLAKAVTTMPATQQNYTIEQCEAMMDGHLPYSLPKDFNFTGNVRRYYVAAE